MHWWGWASPKDYLCIFLSSWRKTAQLLRHKEKLWNSIRKEHTATWTSYLRDSGAHFLAAKKAVNAASEQQSSQIYSRHGQLAGSTEETREVEHTHRTPLCLGKLLTKVFLLGGTLCHLKLHGLRPHPFPWSRVFEGTQVYLFSSCPFVRTKPVGISLS